MTLHQGSSFSKGVTNLHLTFLAGIIDLCHPVCVCRCRRRSAGHTQLPPRLGSEMVAQPCSLALQHTFKGLMRGVSHYPTSANFKVTILRLSLQEPALNLGHHMPDNWVPSVSVHTGSSCHSLFLLHAGSGSHLCPVLL